MQGVLLRLGVSIHAPAGGATPLRGVAVAFGAFQFTLPRGERPAGGLPIGNPVRVSIHAPAGGATQDNRNEANKLYVSIHAPAGGATLNVILGRCRSLVSIHAPAGGAT